MRSSPLARVGGIVVAWSAAVLAAGDGWAQDAGRPPEVGVLGGAQPLLPIDYRVEMRGEGPVYQAVAHLTFRNPRMRVVEGVALIPIPAGAIPRGVLVINGDVKMRGVVRSRTRALDTYRTLTRGTGRDPAVVEQLDDRWLRATLSPVAADDSVELQVSYLGFSERIGERRMVALPSPRRALRGGGANGVAPTWLDTAPAPSPLSTWCFRAPGSEGMFCSELDPSAELATPLTKTTTLLVVETPESTPADVSRAAGRALVPLVQALDERDRVNLFDDAHDSGLFGDLPFADAAHRADVEALLAENSSRGWGRLEQKVLEALARSESATGPVRLIVVSSQRRVARAAEMIAAVERAAALHGDDFACFTIAIGSSAETTALADAARVGRGRAFVVSSLADAEIIASAMTAAARRPTLRLPQVEVAGGAELVAESRTHLTFGETMRVVGRYDEAMTAPIRWKGIVRGRPVEILGRVELPDEDLAHPWVATAWAGMRAQQLRRECTGDGSDNYITRLCERFGLLGPETVSLSLEPALSDRMPPLVGRPGEPVAALDPPVIPTRPTDGCKPDTGRDRRDERGTPVPVGPNPGPNSLPGQRPGPSQPPVIPSQPTPAPPSPGRGGHR